MTEQDRTDTRPIGARPGVNGDPLGPTVRDAPSRSPRRISTMVLETAPFLLLAAVVVLIVAGR